MQEPTSQNEEELLFCLCESTVGRAPTGKAVRERGDDGWTGNEHGTYMRWRNPAPISFVDGTGWDGMEWLIRATYDIAQCLAWNSTADHFSIRFTHPSWLDEACPSTSSVDSGQATRLVAAREKREDSLRESGAETFQQCEREPEVLHGADKTLKGSHVYDVCIKKKRQKDPSKQQFRLPNKKRCQALFSYASK